MLEPGWRTVSHIATHSAAAMMHVAPRFAVAQAEPRNSRAFGGVSVFTGTSHPHLARRVCEYVGLPLGKAEFVKFSNENIFPKINQNVREHDVFLIQPTYPNVSDSIMELLIMIDALKRASASRITAVIPYFAYGRSDKKDQPRVPITARLMAELLQVAGADRVLTMDLHAGQ